MKKGLNLVQTSLLNYLHVYMQHNLVKLHQFKLSAETNKKALRFIILIMFDKIYHCYCLPLVLIIIVTIYHWY